MGENGHQEASSPSKLELFVDGALDQDELEQFDDMDSIDESQSQDTDTPPQGTGRGYDILETLEMPVFRMPVHLGDSSKADPTTVEDPAVKLDPDKVLAPRAIPLSGILRKSRAIRTRGGGNAVFVEMNTKDFLPFIVKQHPALPPFQWRQELPKEAVHLRSILAARASVEDMEESRSTLEVEPLPKTQEPEPTPEAISADPLDEIEEFEANETFGEVEDFDSVDDSFDSVDEFDSVEDLDPVEELEPDEEVDSLPEQEPIRATPPAIPMIPPLPQRSQAEPAQAQPPAAQPPLERPKPAAPVQVQTPVEPVQPEPVASPQRTEPRAEQRGNLVEELLEAPPSDEPKRPSWFEEIFTEEYFRTLPMGFHRQTRREAQSITDSLSVGAGGRILDLCCGFGRHTLEMAKRGYDMVGLDLSLPLLQKGLNEAQRRKLSIKFIHGDIRELNFQDIFDACYCFHTSYGYFDERTNYQVLRGVFNALKPGGRFLLEVLNRDHIIQMLPRRKWWEGPDCLFLEEVSFLYETSQLYTKRSFIYDDGRPPWEQNIYIRLFALHELRHLLSAAGFELISVSGDFASRKAFFGGNSPHLIILAEKKF